MPSDKRTRQRESRAQKQAAIDRHRKRRATFRRVLTFGGLAAVIVLIVVLIQTSGGGKKASSTTTTSVKAGATTSSSSTTSSSVPTSTFPVPSTVALTATPVAPKCLTTTSATRVVLFTKAPPNCIGTTSVWDAVFDTSVGSFTVEMDAAKSYAAVNNFVFLAEYQYYNGTFFHRIIPGFVVQGGDPAGTGSGGATGSGPMKYGYPGYQWTGNTPPASCKTQATTACYEPGDIAMANSTGPSSNASQFFLILPGGQKVLNGEPNYTDFGKVTGGLSTVEKLGTYGTSSGTPTTRVYLEKVTVSQVKA